MNSLIKILSLSFSLALTSTSFAAPSDGVVCKEILFFVQTEQGAGSFQSSGMAVTVRADATSPSGWAADLSQNGQSQTETDVKVTLENPPQPGDEIYQIASVIVPEVNLAAVKSMRVAVVGVKANEQDGGGMTILELLNERSEILGQLVQIGWGFGKCAQ